MNHNNLQRLVTGFLKENQIWNRVISLDIEADLRILDDPNKTFLSISTARRTENRVDIQKFVLNAETLEEEVKIFNDFTSFCSRSNPLVFIGYNVIGFDLPVLVLKMRQLNEKSKQSGKYRPNYWAFIEVLGKSYFLDMMDPIKSEIAKFDNASPRFISLENAISHKRFSHIPFMRTKNIVSDITNNSTINKWDAIYNLWKNDKNSFNKYIEGDVHDTLLLAEELFNTS